MAEGDCWGCQISLCRPSVGHCGTKGPTKAFRGSEKSSTFSLSIAHGRDWPAGPSAAARRSNLTHAREAAAAMPAKRAKVEAPDVDIKTELAVASLAEENIPLIAVKQENENGGVLKRETSGVAMKVERFAPEIKQEV